LLSRLGHKQEERRGTRGWISSNFKLAKVQGMMRFDFLIFVKICIVLRHAARASFEFKIISIFVFDMFNCEIN